MDYEQAVAAYRKACHAFAHRTGSGGEVRAAEAALRRAGRDETTGTTTIPVAAVHFSDVRADGARMAAVNGSILGGEVWVCWKGRALRFGVETATYRAWDLVQVRWCTP